jgi:hypothetical protein
VLNRADWQRLAEEKILAANALLAALQWAAAYYLAGYAIECGLKSCILVRLAASPEIIFDGRKNKRFSESCWSHDIEALVELAAYTGRPPKIPFTLRGVSFGGTNAEEVYLLQAIRGYSMSTGRETLNQIIDQEAEFFQRHGEPPHKIKLPVLMAYDLAKCGRDELGELAGRIFKDGIVVLEKEGFHGMNVEIVRNRDAALQFE